LFSGAEQRLHNLPHYLFAGRGHLMGVAGSRQRIRIDSKNVLQVVSSRRTQMRTLVGTFLLAASLFAGPALAQQNPWVASCVYTNSCFDTGGAAYGQASRHHYQGLRGARGSASSIRVPVRSTQPEATFHPISALP